MQQLPLKARGADFNPPNRFEEIHLESLGDEVEGFMGEEGDRNVPTKFYLDSSKSILARNDSPDVGFTYSINPYRGCEHGCIYCYARPSHEYLAQVRQLEGKCFDFESKSGKRVKSLPYKM